MDVAEADRLARDFARHTKVTTNMPSRVSERRWDRGTIWLLSILLGGVMACGVVIALY